MNKTPLSGRYTIGIFGRRNVGKSSLINALTEQDVALTSKTPGTTTDPVYKAMELLPIGPIVFIDTAGLDDVGELGRLRVKKSHEVLRKCNLAIIVTDDVKLTSYEQGFIDKLQKNKTPYILVFNKADKMETGGNNVKKNNNLSAIYVSSKTKEGISRLKSRIIECLSSGEKEPSLISGLINEGDTAVLVTPIDKSAPKGRLILPQQQTIRDILDINATAFITKEDALSTVLERLKKPPAIVITDSQVFQKVAETTPITIPLTSFSILFARQKSDLTEMVKGALEIKNLKKGEKVLIVEGCTHHRQDDDIATVKIPRWINKITGKNVEFGWASGSSFPKNTKDYAAIVHCGGCMLNSKEMCYRAGLAKKEGVPITNYGVLAAYAHRILPRALTPFPDALKALC